LTTPIQSALLSGAMEGVPLGFHGHLPGLQGDVGVGASSVRGVEMPRGATGPIALSLQLVGNLLLEHRFDHTLVEILTDRTKARPSGHGTGFVQSRQHLACRRQASVDGVDE
jgi:hypothetical protein